MSLLAEPALGMTVAVLVTRLLFTKLSDGITVGLMDYKQPLDYVWLSRRGVQLSPYCLCRALSDAELKPNSAQLHVYLLEQYDHVDCVYHMHSM